MPDLGRWGVIEGERQGQEIHHVAGDFRLVAARGAPAEMMFDDAGVRPVERAEGVGFHLIEDIRMVRPGRWAVMWRLIRSGAAQDTGTSSVVR